MRLYSDVNGESHFEDVSVEFILTESTSPAAALWVSLDCLVGDADVVVGFGAETVDLGWR